MGFTAAAYTDIGISRPTNQDSICVARGILDGEEIAMAIVCDGMGGYEKGEVASAQIVQFFAAWFAQLPTDLVALRWEDIPLVWCGYLERLNQVIYQYGNDNGIRMGSTFSGILLWRQKYLLVHVGDSRIYRITDHAAQLTSDHVHPKHRHMLTRCIGSPNIPEPQIRMGDFLENTTFLLCSDGFFHKISTEELVVWFAPGRLSDTDGIRARMAEAVETAKQRGERDNISVALLKGTGDVDDEAVTEPKGASATARAFALLDMEVLTHAEGEDLPLDEGGFGKEHAYGHR